MPQSCLGEGGTRTCYTEKKNVSSPSKSRAVLVNELSNFRDIAITQIEVGKEDRLLISRKVFRPHTQIKSTLPCLPEACIS